MSCLKSFFGAMAAAESSKQKRAAEACDREAKAQYNKSQKVCRPEKACFDYLGKITCVNASFHDYKNKRTVIGDSWEACRNKFYFINLALLTFIFAVLYHAFIFGGKIYAYSDVGSDTVAQYLPVMSFDLKTIFSGNDGIYNLQFGLGRFLAGLIVKYLNPANIMLLIFGEEHLHAGILAATYVKYVGIWLFSFWFFKKLLAEPKAAAISAMFWTFSGFAIVWGQHYQFLTAMLAFTAAVYGFQLFLQEDKKQWLVVPCMAYLAGVSYYFFYISCFFFLIYGVAYLYLRGKGVKYILRRAGMFVLMLIPALCMSAIYLFPALDDFFASARMQNVTAAYNGVSLFYDIKTILAFVSRVLSNDLLGIGSNFQGPTNYYECAILSTSVLFVFSLVYLLRSRYWKQTLFLAGLCFCLLIMPVTSRILSFAVNTQRWSYTLCFAEVIAIGFALSDYLKNRDKTAQKHILRTIFIADVIIAALCLVLYICFGGALHKGAYIIIFLTLLIYHVGFAFAWKSSRPVQLLAICVVIELILINYPAVNHRISPTKEQWNEAMYHDGTEEVVQWIREQDDSLYRIAKTYTSVSSNDALMQNYNGMGVYLSTNQAELIQLVQSYGYLYAGNFIDIDGSDALANTMLGVKYLISRSNEPVDPLYYDLIYDDGVHAVYENRYWLGFGYLYQQKIPESTILSAAKLEKQLLLSRYYYAANDEVAENPVMDGIKKVDILPYLNGYANCAVTEKDGVQILGTAEDMQLYFDISQLTDGWSVAGVQLTMTAQEESLVQLFVATPEVGYCEENSSRFYYDAGKVSCVLESPVASEVTGIRLDPAWYAQTVTIQSLDVILVNRGQLINNLTSLQERRIMNVVQEGNIFRCDITNPLEGESVLCIPLIYSKYWKATVDGEPAEVTNINGGLVGIPVEQGVHTISIQYCNNTYLVGSCVSIVSVAVYFLGVFMIKRNSSRKKGEGND